jgi:hypothetical protein
MLSPASTEMQPLQHSGSQVRQAGTLNTLESTHYSTAVHAVHWLLWLKAYLRAEAHQQPCKGCEFSLRWLSVVVARVVLGSAVAAVGAGCAHYY